MKDMGETRYILAVKIIQNCPKMHASKCLRTILDLYCESVDTPIEKGLTLSLVRCPKTDDEMDNVPCVSVIGSLM